MPAVDNEVDRDGDDATMGATDQKAPHLTAVVHRERLLNRLREVRTPGIVVVSAPAAQGKSTLIADYLAAIDAPTCWIHLRPENAGPQSFYRHLEAACHPHRLPPSKTSSRRGTGVDTAEDSLSEKIKHLFHHLPADLHIVFDGWHHLAPVPQNVAWVEALLAACPAQGCLYVISRENVAVGLQRKRMRRQALLLSGAELAFTAEEIDAFLQSLADVPKDLQDGQYIQDVTAGWAGGLVLLADALHRHQGNPQNVLHSPSLAGMLQAEAADFFQEEIYDHQSGEMKHFLTLAALLDTVRADVLQPQLGREEADRLFAEASRRNLFLQPLDGDGAQWRFRFNPLFRAFLRERGRHHLTHQTRCAVLQRAARQREAAGRHAEAVTYYLRAHDTRAAAIRITKIGLRLAMEGRFAEIDSWTAMLPQDIRKSDPWLALLHALTFRIKGGQRTIRELSEVKTAFDRSGHLRESMLSLAYLIETAVFIGYNPKDRRQWLAEGEALLKEASRRPHFSFAKALLWHQLGFGAITADNEDLRKGLSACQNAVILGKSIAAPQLVANAQTVAAHAHVQAGDLEQARESLRAAEALADGETFPEYGALRDLTRIHLEMTAGRLEAAADRLNRLAGDIDTLGLLILYPAYIEASGRLQIHRQQYAALQKTRHHMRDVAILLNNSVYSTRAAWLESLGRYHQGQYRHALSALQPALTTPDLPAADQARGHELMGFIDLNLGELTAAAVHFKDALTIFEGAGMPLGSCETRIGQALVEHARGDEEAARRHLDTAFRAPIMRRCDCFPVIRPADLERACVLCLEQAIGSADDQARRLLAARLSETRPPGLTTGSAPASAMHAHASGADQTRRAVHRARIPVLAIRTFGGLDVQRNRQAPIAADGWQGSRPALLLKAILVHGGRNIPKDILIEALWPDQPPEKSLRNFKVTLHRLRRLIEPDMRPAMGSAYIHLRDNLVSLDPELCQVDTDAFHRLCKTVRRTEPGVDNGTLLEMRREADRLYQGDFLPEEPYLTWAEMKRATLREEFLQLLYRLGQLFGHHSEFSEARSCYRRIIRLDPAQEMAQRRLMGLLADAGRSGEAVRLYHDFKTYLETEIGAAPDEATTRLFRSISNPRAR